jgi:hypothetical protein
MTSTTSTTVAATTTTPPVARTFIDGLIGGVNVAIPPGWTAVDAGAAVGDHTSWMFRSRQDPHDQLVIVSSGCVGCSQEPPSELTPSGAYGVVGITATEARYALSTEAQAMSGDQGLAGSDYLPAGYETNGVTVEAGTQPDPAVAYAFVIITQPVTMHSLATTVLDSVTIAPNPVTS